MKLLVVTHAPTFTKQGRFSAYAPYVNEMNLWFKSGHSIGILSPGTYPEAVLEKEFDFQQIKFFRLPFLKIQTIIDGITFFFILPFIFYKFFTAFWWADHIHLRCPGNIGFLGCIMQVFFPGKHKTAKYAGNWDPNADQPLSYQLQKWILKNTLLTRNMTVLVYGEWPEQTKNIKPFFTASFKESEKDEYEKEHKTEFRFLFVGTLVPGKNPLLAAQIVENLNLRNILAELHIYGDGMLMQQIKEFAADKNYIHLHRNQPLEVVKEAYKKSHFVILASKSEGWPKAVAEGMFFGCIPIATPVSCVPWMLDYGKRGILVPPPDTYRNQNDGVELEKWLEDIIKDIEEVIKKPGKMNRMSMAAQEWSQQFTLERFEAEILNLLAQQYKEGE